MPMTSAARRASRASSSVQQPRAPVRYDDGFDDNARWTPVTSGPASTARAAAVAESTPPDIAASTRRPLIAQKAYAPSPTTADMRGRCAAVPLLRGARCHRPPRREGGAGGGASRRAAAGLAGGGAAGAGYGFADHQ